MNVSTRNTKGVDVTGVTERTITCHFCFEKFEVDIEIGETFTGHNTEVYDGEISSLTISDGNE